MNSKSYHPVSNSYWVFEGFRVRYSVALFFPDIFNVNFCQNLLISKFHVSDLPPFSKLGFVTVFY